MDNLRESLMGVANLEPREEIATKTFMTKNHPKQLLHKPVQHPETPQIHQHSIKSVKGDMTVSCITNTNFNDAASTHDLNRSAQACISIFTEEVSKP